MMVDGIVQHNDWKARERPHLTYKQHLAYYYARNGHGVLPPETDVVGEVKAYINHGRWVIECPVCYSAVVADKSVTLFICPTCGGGHMWQQVVFPANATAIEAVLLKRPGFREHAPSRNWLPSETVGMLRAENAARGIS